MAAILLVVGDSAAPTTPDSYLQGILEGLGHTVTLRSDDVADSVTGFDGVVIAESVASATIGTKYNTAAVPVITHETGNINDLRLSDVEGTTEVGGTQIDVPTTTHPIFHGPFGTFPLGTYTIFTSPAGLGYDDDATFPSGVELLAHSNVNSARQMVFACEAGATLTSGTAEGKRAFIFPTNTAAPGITATGEAMLKNAYAWAFGTFPDSVRFDGTDDKMVFGIGNADIPAGPITIAMVIKDNSFTLTNYDALLVAEDGGTTRWWTTYLFGDTDGHFVLGTTAGDDSSASVVSLQTLGLTGQWVIVVVTKANGAVAPRYHRYDPTNGWGHQNSAGTLADGTTPPSTAKIQLGLDSLFGSPADVNMLIFGIKDAVMSDGEIEALSNGYQAWIDAGFIEGVRLDAVSGLDSYVSGGAMALESVTGAVVDAGDAPFWWDDTSDLESLVGYQRIVGPVQLASSAATLYTVPDGQRVELRNIYASNPSGGVVDVTLSIGTDAAATRIWDAMEIPADDSYTERRRANHTLEAGDTIQGFASSAATVVLMINGYVESV